MPGVVDPITFTVLGKPQPAGSKRGFVSPETKRVIIVDAAKGSRSWKQEIAHAAQAALVKATAPGSDVCVLLGALRVEIEFYVARPKGHYNTRGELRPAAPAWPAVRPDVDKLSRAVLDGMSGALYRDDAQIIRKSVRKLYGAPEGCIIRVWPLALQTVGDVETAHEFALEAA